MNELVKDLGLKNCIKFSIGKVEILLDYFKAEYMGMLGVDSLIIKADNNYFKYGWSSKNKIVDDLQKEGIEVRNLESAIHNKIAETVKKGLEKYYEENKHKQLFNRDDIYVYRNYSQLGKTPLPKIEENFKTYIEWNNMTNIFKNSLKLTRTE